ncbi:unnamed protein product [marine sediment metagenome]|uniref:Uncharacterized protein n=1 Tax=marine sediment metagenome TaxID=412755 RepID=X0SZM3_9ZZZZ
MCHFIKYTYEIYDRLIHQIRKIKFNKISDCMDCNDYYYPHPKN